MMELYPFYLFRSTTFILLRMLYFIRRLMKLDPYHLQPILSLMIVVSNNTLHRFKP